MTRVRVTFEFEAADRDTALEQARWFVEQRVLPSSINIPEVTADGENLLTTDLLLRRFRYCVMCLSGQHKPEAHS